MNSWPLDGHAAVTWRQAASRGAVSRLSCSQLMAEGLGQSRGARTRKLLHGRAVFIGRSAFISDRAMTPLGWQPGVVVQANA